MQSGQAVAPQDVRVTTESGAGLRVRAWVPERPLAPAIVLLHGVVSNARIWDPVARLVAAAGHPAYALDFRGHGESADAPGAFNIPDFTVDVSVAIEELGLDRPVVVGHSLGANVALELAACAPASTRGVVLVDGGLARGNAQFDSWEQCLERMQLPPVVGLPRAAVEGFLRKSNPGWSEERLDANMASFLVRDDGTVEYRLKPEPYVSLLRSIWVQPLAELWPRVEVPALAIAADTGDARWTKAKRSGAAAAQSVARRLRVAWLDGDHDIQADKPEAVARLILGAIDEGLPA